MSHWLSATIAKKSDFPAVLFVAAAPVVVAAVSAEIIFAHVCREGNSSVKCGVAR
jgi:hypothetical protein